MYNSGPCKHDHSNMSWAIARQDEALEDLIQSTRQVIKRHTDYISINDRYPPDQSQQYHHNNSRQSYNKQKQSCSHRHKNRIHPPPPPPHYRSYTPPSYNNSHHHYEEPLPPPPPQQQRNKQYNRSFISPLPSLPPPPPPPPREYYNKSPEDSFSKTRKWLNRLMPNNYHPNNYSKQDKFQHYDHSTDDDVGLLELKEKIRRTSTKPKIPPPSTSRPMIIPAITKANPEKVIVIDVPLDITVILRSVDQKDAKMYHVTDLNLIEEILGGNSEQQVEPPSPPKKIKKPTKPLTMRASHTMPNFSSTPSSATVMSSPPEKKKGLTKYFSTLKLSSVRDYNYMDSDDSSTLEEVKEQHVTSASNSSRTSISEEEEEEDMEKRPVPARLGSSRKWMV